MRLWKTRRHEHWYRSNIDNSRQPYWTYKPRGYRRRRPCPLLVMLHGYGGTGAGMINEVSTALADQFGYVLLAPNGRGNTFYEGVGEDDVMRAIRCARRRYDLDHDRIYLMGVSMGGTGVWRLALRHPHMFAAIVPICGWADRRIWYPRYYAPAGGPPELPPWRSTLLDRTDASTHADVLAGLPTLIFHGTKDDVVDPDNARRMFAELRRLGGEVVLKEYARSRHKGFDWRWKTMFEWFEGRAVRSWIRTRRVGPASEPGVKRRRPTFQQTPSTPRRCSVGDAFAEPFALVPAGTRDDQTEAEYFARLWERWMLPRDDNGTPIGRCRVTHACDVTPALMAQRNLILFGIGSGNTLIDNLSRQLPAGVTPTSISLGSRTWAGRNLGLRAVLRNPLAPDRRVVLWKGHMPMRAKDLEALPWVMPEYVVFDPATHCRRTTHPAWDAFDRRLAEEGICEHEVPEEERPPLYLPDCFLDAGFFD